MCVAVCRGSLTGQFSEEGNIGRDSLPPHRGTSGRTPTLAIGEETGQKERVIMHGKKSVKVRRNEVYSCLLCARGKEGEGEVKEEGEEEEKGVGEGKGW